MPENPRTQSKTVIHLSDLTLDPENARKHNPRNVGMVGHSLQSFGPIRSISIDEHNVVLAGNATVEAAAAVGIEGVRVFDRDTGELGPEPPGGPPYILAVRVTGLTPEQKRQYAIADNRTTDLSEWDTEQLAAFLDEGSDLGQWFFEDELADLLNLEDEPAVGLTDPDAVPEPPAEPITKPGDVWILGEHRLMCGDSGNPQHIARLMNGERASLMATDPPYGVDFSGAKYNPRAKQWAGIEGDKRQGDDLRVWLSGCIALWLEHVHRDAGFYFWSAAMEEGFAALGAIRDAGLHVQSQIIWVKNALVLGQADYQWKHENCWYAFFKGERHKWNGGRAQTTVWEIDKVANNDYVHPMQKPTELFAIPMRNHTQPGDICAEPFAGSGSQIIAAEQEGRRCYAMEFDPRHVDVIVKRYEDFSGQTAHREPAAEAAD